MESRTTLGSGELLHVGDRPTRFARGPALPPGCRQVTRIKAEHAPVSSACLRKCPQRAARRARGAPALSSACLRKGQQQGPASCLLSARRACAQPSVQRKGLQRAPAL
eukprot:6151831-Alexandrium_andersonii.AAC.1